jgi:HK97 family phage portal protein
VIADIIRNLFRRNYSTTLLGGEMSAVPNVGPLTALRYTPVYRAVTLIAGDIARLNCKLSEPTADVLWRQPSVWWGAFEFRRALMMNALLYGNGFALINRTKGGELLELLLLDNDNVSLDTQSGVPTYSVRGFLGVPAADILHVRAPSTNGLWGESPINLCRTSIQILASQEQMALTSYRNAGNPKIALVHKAKIDEALMQKIENYYMKRHGGAENAGKPVVLGDDVRIERISSTLDDTGLEAARKYSIADVSRLYGVPASYLSEDVGSSYGTMEWLSRMYVDGCLAAWMAAVESELKAKLMNPYASVSWDTDALIRPGVAEQMAALRTGVEGGFLTRNEARAKLDLEPLEGLDAPTLALNVGTGGGLSNLGSDTSEEEGTPNDF